MITKNTDREVLANSLTMLESPPPPILYPANCQGNQHCISHPTSQNKNK